MTGKQLQKVSVSVVSSKARIQNAAFDRQSSKDVLQARAIYVCSVMQANDSYAPAQNVSSPRHFQSPEKYSVQPMNISPTEFRKNLKKSVEITQTFSLVPLRIISLNLFS